MRSIDINFSWQRKDWARLVSVTFFLVGVMIAADVAWQYAETRTEMTTWQRDLQRITLVGKSITIAGSEGDGERTKAELNIANRTIDELNTPWHTVLNAVEVASVEHVTLLGIDPNTDGRELRLHGEARDPAAMLTYLRSLRASPLLVEVHLLGHQVSIQDPNRPVDFAISARWDTKLAQGESTKDTVSAELRP
jgi:hypothetical protein